MILSKFVLHNSKKSRFIKKDEKYGLLSSWGLKMIESKVLLLGDILF